MPWGVDTIFKFDLHHIQMDATQLSCCMWSVDVVSKSYLQHIQMNTTQFSCYHGCDVISMYDFNHMQMYAIQLACCHLVLNAWLAQILQLKVTQKACMFVNKFLKLKKWMGFAKVFIGCNLFDMYVKHGTKKICHEMIICDSKNYIKMKKYNIFSIFLGMVLVMFQF